MRFTGIAAGPGVAVGPICIVHNADEFEHCQAGDIALLVGVKPNAALVSRVEGIAAVHGGITSHAAIAARESNKPAVVGLPAEILGQVKDGMQAKLDADNGIFELLTHE
jgi:phosphoenolpyruvate synthase/pyruvate phosphate dikinase